jgi:hypothetical protein
MHAVAEQGVPAEIAEAIGRAFKLPVASIAADDVQDHFGWVGAYFAIWPLAVRVRRDVGGRSTIFGAILARCRWRLGGRTLRSVLWRAG